MKRRMTTLQVARMHRLEDAVHRAREAVYAGRRDVPFDACLKTAGVEAQAAYAAAAEALARFEARMIREGRAYRSSLGVLTSC